MTTNRIVLRPVHPVRDALNAAALAGAIAAVAAFVIVAGFKLHDPLWLFGAMIAVFVVAIFRGTRTYDRRIAEWKTSPAGRDEAHRRQYDEAEHLSSNDAHG